MMGDLPTLYRLTCIWSKHSKPGVSKLDCGDVHDHRCWVPVTEPLLTREEAANDPEVRSMVHDSIAAKWAWLNETEVTDDG